MDKEDINGDVEEEVQDKVAKKTAKHDSGAADLEKVTDYAEEKELTTQDLSGAMFLIGDQRNKEAAEKMAMERELLKVVIKKEDVDLMVRELEISKAVAERTLRQNHGNVVKALIALTN